MKHTFSILTTIFVLSILSSCNKKSNSDLQSFPEYEISISCPCILKNDSLAEENYKKKVDGTMACYSCTDTKNADTYHFNILIRKKSPYSDDQILHAIDSNLIQHNVKHELKTLLDHKALIVDYGGAKELELYTNKFNYCLVVIAKDSLDQKFERCIHSIEIE